MIKAEDVKINTNQVRKKFNTWKETEKICMGFFSNARRATKEEDMYQHFDIIGDFKGSKNVMVDVKSIKRVLRGDSEPNEKYHWVETQNVRGDVGWLYGKADYIAFETLDNFLFVDRTILVEYIKQIPIPEVLPNTPEKREDIRLNKYYQRRGRLDTIILVKTSDLKQMAKYILKKY